MSTHQLAPRAVCGVMFATTGAKQFYCALDEGHHPKTPHSARPSITPNLDASAVTKCDCLHLKHEDNEHDSVGYFHKAGGCNYPATHTAYFHGHKQNLCNLCMAFSMEFDSDYFEPDLDAIVAAINQGGAYRAELHHSGGGIMGVSVPMGDGSFAFWGTANTTWGADVNDANGELLDCLDIPTLSTSTNYPLIASQITDACTKWQATRNLDALKPTQAPRATCQHASRAEERVCEAEAEEVEHKQRFLDRLRDFAFFAEELSDAWHHELSTSGDAYPFRDSFDEVARNIRLWLEAVEKEKEMQPPPTPAPPTPAKAAPCRKPVQVLDAAEKLVAVVAVVGVATCDDNAAITISQSELTAPVCLLQLLDGKDVTAITYLSDKQVAQLIGALASYLAAKE
jgi:hypothetical protein